MNDLSAAVEAIGTRDPLVLPVQMFPKFTAAACELVIPGSNLGPRRLRELCADLVATMHAYQAPSLAASQVGVPVRVIVVQDGTEALSMVNPTVVANEGHSYETECCLSHGHLWVRIARAESVQISYFDSNLVQETTTLTGAPARAFQRALDLLNGIGVLDRLNHLEKDSALRKLKQQARRAKGVRKLLASRS